MARDIWTQNVMRFDIPDDDDEPEYSAPVVRDGGRTLSAEDAARELSARETERERLEEERVDAELARTLRIPAGGYTTGVTKMRRLVAADKKRIAEQQEKEEGSSMIGEEGRYGA
ncbi:hypothetical protein Srot_0796 [Segniliparus rotundus DSM 44985]|uniref:Uncharacterized protein n=1 Tax=Segniliparus rotundus (strain ATCC BAA-972 / CDC 1076 / CIP 108378 / DSM 44985 / JCM 13578) TaxID=640132 RepID=D6ZDZ5_SEGRD|nr:hypothetical protein [Segniliparus rotundus]ADG97275.1 hypothetical protein Srot_0796 [Segniliparus rotundus DSM 44985]